MPPPISLPITCHVVHHRGCDHGPGVLYGSTVRYGTSPPPGWPSSPPLHPSCRPAVHHHLGRGGRPLVIGAPRRQGHAAGAHRQLGRSPNHPSNLLIFVARAPRVLRRSHEPGPPTGDAEGEGVIACPLDQNVLQRSLGCGVPPVIAGNTRVRVVRRVKTEAVQQIPFIQFCISYLAPVDVHHIHRQKRPQVE